MLTFVPLKRKFVELKAQEFEAPDWYRNEFFSDRALSWDDLSRHRCVLILAPGNSGKTDEMKARVNLLEKQGETAFFIELKKLAKTDDNLLTKELPQKFVTFVKSTDPTYCASFFLDSADELKLTGNDVRTAIANFCNQVGAALSRCSLVISCRGLEFNGEDINVLHEFFFNAAAQANLIAETSEDQYLLSWESNKYQHKPWILRVGMLPLSSSDVEEFVHQRIPHTAANLFMEHLRHKTVSDWVTVPFELDALLSLYESNQSLGDQVELMDELIRQSTHEETNATPLANEKTLDAVQRLALAAVQTGREKISSSSTVEHDAVPAREVLIDLAPSDIKKLLRSKLFLPTGTNQTVVFRHKNQMEYLAAQAIEMLSSKRVVFTAKSAWCLTELYGHKVVPKTRQRIVGWLATFDPELRRQLITFAPLILLEYSALDSFGDSDKRQLVKSIINLYKCQPNVEVQIYNANIQRLSSADIVDYLVETWNSMPTSAHVRRFVIALACWTINDKYVVIFNQVLESPTATDFEKTMAVQGLALHGRFADLRAALSAQLDRELQAVPEILLATLTRLLNHDLPFDLLVRSVPILYRHGNDHRVRLTLFELNVAESTDRQLVIELIKWVADETWRTRKAWNEYGSFESESAHYCELIFVAVAHELRVPTLHSIEMLRACIIVSLFYESYSGSEYAETITRALRSRHSEVQAIVASLVTEHIGEVGMSEFLHVLHELGIAEVWTREFANSILIDTAQQHIVRRAAVLILTSDAQDRTELREPLLAICGEDAELRAYIGLRTEPINSNLLRENIVLNRKAEGRKAKLELTRAEENETKLVFRKALLSDPKTQFAAKSASSTIHEISRWLRHQKQGESNQIPREMIGSLFGPRALTELDGYLAKYWRTTLPSFIDDQNFDTWLLEFALKWDTNGALPATSEETIRYVELACRMGLPYLVKRICDHSHFRSALCASYLATLRDMVNRSDRDWFSITVTLGQNFPEIEADISAIAQDCIVRGCADEFREPARKTWLRQILLAASRSRNLNVEFIKYLEARSSSETDGELSGYWLALLIWNDPHTGVIKVHHALNQCAQEDREKISWKWLKAWYSRWNSNGLLGSKRWRDDELPALTELMAFAFHWAHPETDPPASGDVTLHHDAVDAREMIEMVALHHPGEVGHQNFLKICSDLRFSAHAHWFDRSVVVRLEKEAEPQPQTIIEFRSWLASMHPSPPTNAAQLQGRVRDELKELQEWLTTSDRSPQSTWAAATDELQMHRLIHVQLEHMAKGAYLVDAETETVDGNPVDFRLSFANGQQCAIELKIAYGSYTKPKMIGALEAQLCKKYLLPRDRIVGFLLVVARTNEPVKTQNLNDFESELWTEAKRCSQKYGRLVEPFVLMVKQVKKTAKKTSRK